MAAGFRAFKPRPARFPRSAAQPPPQLPPPVSVVRTAPSRKILESETTALMEEYEEVLRRPKFKFNERDIVTVLLAVPCRFRTIGRNRDLVPRAVFQRLAMAKREVWYPDFCQLRRFGSRGSEKRLVAKSPHGFRGYQTSRFAQGRVPNLGSCREKVPNHAISPEFSLHAVPNLRSRHRPVPLRYQTADLGKEGCGTESLKRLLVHLLQQRFVEGAARGFGFGHAKREDGLQLIGGWHLQEVRDELVG